MAEEVEVREENNESEKKQGRGINWLGIIVRFVVAAIVLMVTSFISPGFASMGFGTALLAAIVIAAIGYLVERIFKVDASPFGRGISGFIISAIIIYVSQFLVPGMSITILGAIIAALVIGLIDMLIPVKVV